MINTPGEKGANKPDLRPLPDTSQDTASFSYLFDSFKAVVITFIIIYDESIIKKPIIFPQFYHVIYHNLSIFTIIFVLLNTRIFLFLFLFLSDKIYTLFFTLGCTKNCPDSVRPGS